MVDLNEVFSGFVVKYDECMAATGSGKKYFFILNIFSVMLSIALLVKAKRDYV